MANPHPHGRPKGRPINPVNDYKRFTREPDLLLKLPEADTVADNLKTREFAIPADYKAEIPPDDSARLR